MKKWYTALVLRRDRSRLRRQLLTLNDRQLRDQGISREQLREGVAAWPWQVEPAVRNRLDPAWPNDVVDEAITALNMLTDGELDDLGLTRGNVHDALKFSRSTDSLSAARRVA